MKKIYQSGILFFFLFCFLTFDSLIGWLNQFTISPVGDEILEMKYQNLLKEFEDLSAQKEIIIPKVNSQIARVLFRDPFEFFEEITISKGTEEGVTPFSAVMTKEGLVGVVTSVDNHTSKVRLLTNQHTNLSVKVGDSFGILTTNSVEENWIKNLTKETTVSKGDLIYTSGLTEVPEGLPIGTVEYIENDELGLTTSIKIKRLVDTSNLTYLHILTKEDIS